MQDGDEWWRHQTEVLPVYKDCHWFVSFSFLDCGVSFLVRRIRMYSLLVLVLHLNQPSCQQPSRSGRMAGGGTGIRKYMGALKDTTTVSIAKVNSDYKVLMSDDRHPKHQSSFPGPLVVAFSHVLNCSFLATLSLWQELDIAIVKATNHVENPTKEKYIRGEMVIRSLLS